MKVTIGSRAPGQAAAFYALRFGLGAAEGANWPVGTQAIRAWAPGKEYGRAVTSMSLGQ
jgi:MFS family permease